MRPEPRPSAGLAAAGRATARRDFARAAGRLTACLRAGLAFGARRAALLFALTLDFAARAMMSSPDAFRRCAALSIDSTGTPVKRLTIAAQALVPCRRRID